MGPLEGLRAEESSDAGRLQVEGSTDISRQLGQMKLESSEGR